MAKALVEKVFEGKEVDIHEDNGRSEPGGHGIRAPVSISWSPTGNKAWFVVADNYVTMEDGTGIVHIAPAFGEDDNRVCQQNGIAFCQSGGHAGLSVQGDQVAGRVRQKGRSYGAGRFEGARTAVRGDSLRP